LGGELGLGRRGEENEAGAAEQPVRVEPPVEGLLEVPEGACALEVRVEHAVGEDHAGFAAGNGLVDGVAEILPHAVEDDAVEVIAVGEKPGVKPPAEPEALRLLAPQRGPIATGEKQKRQR
jgi:hypothetical protein